MRHGVLFSLGSVALAFEVAAQSAVDVTRPEERQKARQAVVKQQEKRAKQTSIIEFRGQQAFSEKELRSALKEEITTIEDFGLSPARADDLAFFLEVFYRKHGYAKVDVHYVLESASRLRLDITEGFLDVVVDPPRYKFPQQSNEVEVIVPIHEGRQYFFGSISFTGQTVYGAEALRGQIVDLLERPYTEARVADIPRRLEAYFKA